MSGNSATCSATPYAAPGANVARRRRDAEVDNDLLETDSIDSAQIYVNNECGVDFCEKTMVLPEPLEKTIDEVNLSESGSDAFTTTISATTLALILLN